MSSTIHVRITLVYRVRYTSSGAHLRSDSCVQSDFENKNSASELIIRTVNYMHFRCIKSTGCPKSLEPMEFYLLFILYAPYVHPDTLRIFSAALPCL
jgi:hypothetical protein